MIKKEKILSFLIVMLLLVAAAMAVNKTIFGEKLQADKSAGTDSSEVAVDVKGAEIILNTTGMPGTTDGYAGPVPLEIKVRDGVIASVTALPNAETPAFFKRAAKLLSVWEGHSPREAMEMKVDGMSGATYSSEAIINNVHVGLEAYLGEEGGPAGTSVPWKIWIALTVTFVACVIPLMVSNKVYHNVQMAANVIVLGFWCGQFLDYALILKCLSGGIALPVGLVAIAMLVAAFVYPLFGRPQHYCNHICPLGSAQQLVGQICGYKVHLSPKTLKGLDWFRKILWAVLMLLLWTDTCVGWMDLELFQAFQYESASWWIIATACVFVALSVIVNRPYCRFVCPTGSLFKRSENIG